MKLAPSPQNLVRFHLVMMAVWVFVTPVTVRFPQSVLWVALMSQYANFVGHFSSYDASRAERSNDVEMKEMKKDLEEIKALLVSAY